MTNLSCISPFASSPECQPVFHHHSLQCTHASLFRCSVCLPRLLESQAADYHIATTIPCAIMPQLDCPCISVSFCVLGAGWEVHHWHFEAAGDPDSPPAAQVQAISWGHRCRHSNSRCWCQSSTRGSCCWCSSRWAWCCHRSSWITDSTACCSTCRGICLPSSHAVGSAIQAYCSMQAVCLGSSVW